MVQLVHPLRAIIDHAALFPPASMTVAEALAEDERVRASPEAWLVGRFVCRASQLGQLGDASLRLSVVADAPVPDDPRVDAIEVPPEVPADAVSAPEVYVERTLDELGWLDDVAARGLRAKIRCGGTSVPPVELVASFVRRCRELGVPFKATAGLHHPVAAHGRHGFLNLLAAATFGDEEAALAEQGAAAFVVDDGRFAWRGREAGADEIARTRRDLFVGFGSCSVAEPVDDLRALGLL